MKKKEKEEDEDKEEKETPGMRAQRINPCEDAEKMLKCKPRRGTGLRKNQTCRHLRPTASRAVRNSFLLSHQYAVLSLAALTD
jgi:hypothetical protein